MNAILYQKNGCKYCYCFSFYSQVTLALFFVFIIDGSFWTGIALFIQPLLMLLLGIRKEVQKIIRYKGGFWVEENFTLLPWINSEVFFDRDDFLYVKNKEKLYFSCVFVVAEGGCFYLYEGAPGVSEFLEYVRMSKKYRIQ